MRTFYKIYRMIRKIHLIVNERICMAMSLITMRGNGVIIGENLISKGIPIIDVWDGGVFILGNNFSMNNGNRYNLIGRQQKCIFVVQNTAKLIIGNNVGISSTAIYCTLEITIGNNVKIGGNTVIYDTDFHSLDHQCRTNPNCDSLNTKKEKVTIGNDVFIGAHTTILKGISIGDNSIIGASSLVSKNIPKDEIWGGNPAKFIRSVSE
jgi:acetyltransferase-like isoleucine patch superfamily enzyme